MFISLRNGTKWAIITEQQIVLSLFLVSRRWINYELFYTDGHMLYSWHSLCLNQSKDFFRGWFLASNYTEIFLQMNCYFTFPQGFYLGNSQKLVHSYIFWHRDRYITRRCRKSRSVFTEALWNITKSIMPLTLLNPVWEDAKRASLIYCLLIPVRLSLAAHDLANSWTKAVLWKLLNL